VINDDFSIAENVKRVRGQIAEAAVRSGRRPEDILLVAAAKMNTADRVREVIGAGVDAVGENRVQELLEKHHQGAYEGRPLHFIGHLQTNKVRQLVGLCDMIESVDSERNSVGQTFQASMDEAVVVDGRTIVPRGADVVVKLVDDKESGRLTGRAELALILSSVKVDGRVVDINTQAVTRASDSRGERTAKMATGGAALGAIIGAIAGGGRGAAIGAASGAGAGTAVQVVTKGQTVRIPSETRLTFALETPVKI
jgi:hypothetical protein